MSEVKKQSEAVPMEDAYQALLKKLQKTSTLLELEQSDHIKAKGALKNSRIERGRLFDTMEKEKGERIRFFSLIAHDLRSPLGTLTAYLEVLIEHFDEMDREEIRSILLSLNEMAGNLSLLTQSLLTWTMHKLDKFECQWVSLDLKELIDKNIDLFSESCIHKEITLISKVDDHIQAYADYDMIDAAIRNFISNAIKFTNKKGAIQIDAKTGGQGIILSIADNGIGMDEKRLSRIFDTWKTTVGTRLSHSGTHGEGGSGMGLLLCKELVEKSGGKIRIESKMGEGTTVFVELLRVPPIKKD